MTGPGRVSTAAFTAAKNEACFEATSACFGQVTGNRRDHIAIVERGKVVVRVGLPERRLRGGDQRAGGLDRARGKGLRASEIAGLEERPVRPREPHRPADPELLLEVAVLRIGAEVGQPRGIVPVEIATRAPALFFPNDW